MASSHHATLLWRFALPLGLVALALFVLLVTASADSLPPASGNWTVDDATTIIDRNITVHGNLTIEAKGSLTLRNLTLTMDPPVDGGCGIYVTEWNKLRMFKVSVLSSDPDKHYWFEIHGEAEIRGCDVRDVAANDMRWSAYGYVRGGVQLFNDDILLADSKFHHCQRINAYAYHCKPTIVNCTFSNAEYYHSDSRTGQDWEFGGTYLAWFTDATGLYLEEADPSIEDCTFSLNGIPGSVLDLYLPATNVVLTMGRGILAFESSPVISNCTFERNGKQPEDRKIDWIDQYFRDFVMYTQPIEGGLVCIGSLSHPIVTDSNFDTNDAYGILGIRGGYPTILDGCAIRSTDAKWGSILHADTGGVHVYDYYSEGQGRMTISNTLLMNNHVAANVYVVGPSITLMNVTARHSTEEQSDNIIMGQGIHEISSCTLEADSGVLANIMFYNSQSHPVVHINGSEIVGGMYAIRSGGGPYVQIRLVECKVWGQSEAAFLIWNARVDCVDCELPEHIFPPSNLDALHTEVHIYYYLEVSVQWQNGVPIAGAHVQVSNTTDDFLCGGFTDANGSLARRPVMARSLYQAQGVTEVSHSPLRLVATTWTVASPVHQHLFVGNSRATVTVHDPRDPDLRVLSPPEGHIQNHTSLVVKGLVFELESGLRAVELSIDGSRWFKTVTKNNTWLLVCVIGEGTHAITVRATDMSGNEAMATVVNVTIDLTPPEITILAPSSDKTLTNSASAKIVGRTEPGSTVLVGWVRAVECVDGEFSAVVALIMEGDNVFWVVSTDRVGNSNRAKVTITRDTQPPVIMLDGLPTLTNERTLPISGRAFDIHPGRVLVNDLAFTNGSFYTVMELVEGDNSITVFATDAAGNSAILERIVTLDTSIPLATIFSPGRDILTHTPTITVEGMVRGDFETLLVNGQVVEAPSVTFHHTVRLSEGSNLIIINVTDAAGNRWDDSRSITLDSIPPVVALEHDPDGTVTNRYTLELRGSVEGATMLTIDGEPVDPTGGFVHSVDLDETGPDGEPNVIWIVASDAAGNVAGVPVRVWRDSVVPEISLDTLAPETRARYVVVTGSLSGAGDLSTLTVNGIHMAVEANGTFHGLVLLEEGPNTLVVRAVDRAGNEVVQVRTVERLPEEVEEPVGMGPWLPSLATFAAALVLTVLVGRGRLPLSRGR